MDINLELYRVFCEVVKYKNISKTAENMFISQSAITQSIKKLESKLGGKIFYRNKSGVELTEEGKKLYEYIKDSVETLNNAENIYSNYITLEEGKVRIGGGNSLINSLVVDSLMEFMQKYPNVEVSVHKGATDNLMRKLINGELDILTLNILKDNNDKYANVEIIPLKKQRYVFFASKEFSKENNLKQIKDLAKLNEYRLILPTIDTNRYKVLKEYLDEKNVELSAAYRMSNSDIVKQMVLSNVGIGYTIEDAIEDIKDKVDVILSIEDKDIKVGIATLKKSMRSKATSELIKMIVENFKK